MKITMKFAVLMCAALLAATTVLSACGEKVSNIRPTESLSATQILAEERGKAIQVDTNSAAHIEKIEAPADAVTGERAEFKIDIAGLDGNVYDYEEVDVYGEFVSPKGEVLTVPAFYYKDYTVSLEEYDYTAEYPLTDWSGGAVGVFDQGDNQTAGRGVVKIEATAANNYNAQKYVNMKGIDALSSEVFFSVKRVGTVPAAGYSIGFYSDTTGASAQYKLDAALITDEWMVVSIPYSEFSYFLNGAAAEASQAQLARMTTVKFFGDASQPPEGSFLVKDLGVQRAGGRFPSVIDSFSVSALSQYIDTDSYNGHEVLEPGEEEPSFRLRFNADEAGEYVYRITLKEEGSVTAKYTSSFTVKENEVEQKGTVKVEPQLKRNFIYENGEPFLAIGENVGWYTATEKKVYEYFDIFEHMSDVGMNWARVFMMDYQFALFNYESGTVDFSARQDQAYRLDKVIEKAEEEGIYIALVFLIHGQFVEETSVEDTWQAWNSNPFNVNCGGYLQKPWDFFTSERAKADFKKLARYIVARWGYSDNIFAWELWNEVNHLTDYEEKSADSNAWHSEMARFIKGIDSFHHMVTSSIGVPLPNDPLHAVEELDYNNIHVYAFNNYSSALIDDYLEPMWQKYNKPVLISEIGSSGDNAQQNMLLDPNLVYIEQSIWSGSFSGAGGGFTWWWEMIDAMNVYDVYRPIQAYFSEVDADFVTLPSLTAKDYTVETALGASASELVRVVGMKGTNKVYAYMYDENYNKDKQGTAATLYSDTVLTFEGMENGTYIVKVFDVREGTFLSTATATASGGKLSANVGSWRMDVAVLIEKN